MKKIPVSIAIITQDEESNIRTCIESVDWGDEIIVIDGGSIDLTVEIAESLGAKVIHNKWPGHIEQKNFAIEHCSNDWIFSIDADERVSERLKSEILNVFEDPDTLPDAYFCPRKVFYLGKWISHSGWYPDYKIRLFKKSKAKWGGHNPHDKIILDGKAQKLKGDLLHYPYKNLSDHLKRINSYTTIMAEGLFKEKKSSNIFKIIFNPYFRFLRAYILKLGFLDGFQGLMISILGAYYVFLKYLKLWELQKLQNGKKKFD
ncbi:glycosyltransferase family 2 protein [Candidatus Dependentiae bacterium]|nr:glycosyltransferase family 2 protein [Candidatus Dependentiae bacterium]